MNESSTLSWLGLQLTPASRSRAAPKISRHCAHADGRLINCATQEDPTGDFTGWTRTDVPPPSIRSSRLKMKFRRNLQAFQVRLMSEVTRILSAIEQGDPHAAEQLLPLVYDELRTLAAAKLAQEKPGQTLEATALVHEAYLRLVASPGRASGESEPHWNSRGHFFAAAAEAMRRILVDAA